MASPSPHTVRVSHYTRSPSEQSFANVFHCIPYVFHFCPFFAWIEKTWSRVTQEDLKSEGKNTSFFHFSLFIFHFVWESIPYIPPHPHLSCTPLHICSLVSSCCAHLIIPSCTHRWLKERLEKRHIYPHVNINPSQYVSHGSGAAVPFHRILSRRVESIVGYIQERCRQSTCSVARHHQH